MTKRKKRNAITLISLLLALVALLGVYYWYVNLEVAVDDTEEETQTISLATLDTDKLSTLHYTYKDADMILVLEEEVWKSEAEPDRPINQENVTKLIGVIDEISATRLVSEEPEKLEDYGLAKPAAYLQATLTDGVTVTLKIGNEVSTGDGYYALVNEDKKVYLLPTSYGSGLKYSNADMTSIEEGPMIEAANIHHITIDMREGDDFELLYDKENTLDNSDSEMFSWVIVKPYEEGCSADSSAVSTLQEKYTTFDYISCSDYTVEDLTQYGLDKPMASIALDYYVTKTETLEEPETDAETGEEITEKTYYDEMQYKLYIGDQDESGNYYVITEGSNAVYTMSASSIDTMLEVDAFSLINKFVAIPNIDKVDLIDININDAIYTMSMERATVKNEEGEDEVQTTYFYNGKEVKEEAFKDVYQTIIASKYDAEIKEEITTDGVDPYLTITFHLNDEANTVLTASYLPYDESFYTVKVDNVTRFFADKRKVDNIVTEILEFKATEE